jgi:hypothetical protein
MTIIDTLILLAAWISSLGLLGAVVVLYAQTDAAQERKRADEWILSRYEMQLLVPRPGH